MGGAASVTVNSDVGQSGMLLNESMLEYDHFRLMELQESLTEKFNNPDAAVFYECNKDQLSSFDKFYYHFWKTMFGMGRVLGYKGWRIVTGIGDGVFSVLDWFRNIRLFGNKSKKIHFDDYMYSEFDEEFDISLDDESLQYLESLKYSELPKYLVYAYGNDYDEQCGPSTGELEELSHGGDD